MKSLSLALLLAALSILDLAEAGQVGRWSKCYGSPPADSFGGPDQHIPAWSPYWNRYGRANPIGYHDDNGKCKAYFPWGWEREQGSGEFYVLRYVTLSAFLKFDVCDSIVWVKWRSFQYFSTS